MYVLYGIVITCVLSCDSIKKFDDDDDDIDVATNVLTESLTNCMWSGNWCGGITIASSTSVVVSWTSETGGRCHRLFHKHTFLEVAKRSFIIR